MATERLSPDAVLESPNYTTLNIGNIQDDPDSPDATYGTWDTNGNTIARVSFPTPSGNPTVGAGLQEFRVLIRRNGATTNTGWSLQLYENGTIVGTALATGTLTNTTPVVVSGTWDASTLGTADGSLVECRLEQTSGGTGGTRSGVEVGAVEWNVTYTVSAIVTPVFAQAQVSIKQISNAYGQATSDIKVNSNVFAQGQADVLKTYEGFGQAQTTIAIISSGFGQSQTTILISGFSNSNSFAQANSVNGVTNNLYTSIDEIIPDDSDYITSQLPTGIYTAHFGLTELIAPNYPINHIIAVRAQDVTASILTVNLYEGATLRATFNVLLTTLFDTYTYYLTPAEIASITDYSNLAIEFVTTGRALISWVDFKIPSAQAISRVYAFAQAQTDILVTSRVYANAQADVKVTSNGYAQAQTNIKAIYQVYAQAQAQIKQIYNTFAQAQVDIKSTSSAFGQAQGYIRRAEQGFAQAQAWIEIAVSSFGQAQGTILSVSNKCGNAQGIIKQVYQGHANAQAVITTASQVYSNAQGYVLTVGKAYGQANALIVVTDIETFGQANAYISTQNVAVAQAQAFILAGQAYGQAQGYILITHFLKSLTVSDRESTSLAEEDAGHPNLTLSDRRSMNLTVSDRVQPTEATSELSIGLVLSDRNYEGV